MRIKKLKNMDIIKVVWLYNSITRCYSLAGQFINYTSGTVCMRYYFLLCIKSENILSREIKFKLTEFDHASKG